MCQSAKVRLKNMSREKGYGVPSLADGPSYGTLCINVKKIR